MQSYSDGLNIVYFSQAQISHWVMLYSFLLSVYASSYLDFRQISNQILQFISQLVHVLFVTHLDRLSKYHNDCA